MNVCDRTRSCEARVHVYDRRASLLGEHHPAKTHRVALGHIGAFDEDTIRVCQILQRGGGSSSSERGSQTGNRGGVSNTGLVFYLYYTKGAEELFKQVVFFVVECRAAEMRHAQRSVDCMLTFVRLPAFVAGLLDALGNHLHRLRQRNGFPLGPVGFAIKNLLNPMLAGY